MLTKVPKSRGDALRALSVGLPGARGNRRDEGRSGRLPYSVQDLSSERAERLRAVSVPVVDVRVMRMPVHHRRVPVPVAVRLAGGCIRIVGVLVVRVVAVAVLVLQRLMCVLVLMLLREVQPEAERHE